MMKRRTISISDILWLQIEARAKALGISISDLIRRSAENYLEERNVKEGGLGEPDRKEVR
jgi:metal-responsive CopG/Arc/MetJ family transcriptional regulator